MGEVRGKRDWSDDKVAGGGDILSGRISEAERRGGQGEGEGGVGRGLEAHSRLRDRRLKKGCSRSLSSFLCSFEEDTS